MPAKTEEIVFSAKMNREKEMSENQLLDTIERYLNGEMKADERKKFEALRKSDTEVNARVVEHQQFLGLLKQYSERIELEQRLNIIHAEIDVDTLKENLMEHPSTIVQMWRNHHSKISVAASVAILAVLTILYFTGNLNTNTDPKIVALSRKVDRLDQSNKNLSASIRGIKNSTKPVIVDKYSGVGTSFAITADGVLATNYHVIQGSDSVYVQNAEGQSFKARVIYTEPQHDIAILKIIDPSFTNLASIPYTFKKSDSDLAEQVSTYGFPDGYAAYIPGSLSAKTGVNGDSIHYKITIPINPGNSGGPLWDSKGNLIGITDAKQSQAEGEHFAIKSKYLLDAIKNIPSDSLNKKVVLNKKNTLTGLNDAKKMEKAKNYVFMVKVYN